MPYIKPTELDRVKQIDLFSYLEQYEPNELVRIGTNSYRTKTHDSLKLSNGRWYWWSQGFGGKTALDYLIKVRGMSFIDAVRRLGVIEVGTLVTHVAEVSIKKELQLPKAEQTNDTAINYLKSRGIDFRIVNYCLEKDLIYVTRKGENAAVVFVGKDGTGYPRYAAIRSITGNFKGEATGSDKRFSFRLESCTSEDSVHIFEGAIDALSYATILLENDQDWHELNLLSLGGIPPVGSSDQKKLPPALTQYLVDNPQTKYVYLHLDNDEPGIKASGMIASVISQLDLGASINPPKEGKDINDYLMQVRSR